MTGKIVVFLRRLSTSSKPREKLPSPPVILCILRKLNVVAVIPLKSGGGNGGNLIANYSYDYGKKKNGSKLGDNRDH